MENSTTLQTIITSMGDVMDLGFTVLEKALSNPILVFFLASAFVGIGVGVFKRLRSIVR